MPPTIAVTTPTTLRRSFNQVENRSVKVLVIISNEREKSTSLKKFNTAYSTVWQSDAVKSSCVLSIKVLHIVSFIVIELHVEFMDTVIF